LRATTTSMPSSPLSSSSPESTTATPAIGIGWRRCRRKNARS
jgi:hypothetical protein